MGLILRAFYYGVTERTRTESPDFPPWPADRPPLCVTGLAAGLAGFVPRAGLTWDPKAENPKTLKP